MELKSRSSSSRVVVVVMVVMLGKEVFGMVGGHSVWKAVPWPTAPIGMKSWFGSKSRSIFWIGEAWPGWLLSSIASPLTTDSWCAGMGCKRAIQAKRQPRSFVRIEEKAWRPFLAREKKKKKRESTSLCENLKSSCANYMAVQGCHGCKYKRGCSYKWVNLHPKYFSEITSFWIQRQ